MLINLVFVCISLLDQKNDNKYKEWREEHIMGYMCCLYGEAQYKKGTGLWATERKGMINAPDFGRVLPKDRFTRINRYLQV